MDNPERYELWARKGQRLEILATSGTPQGMGLAMVTLWEEGEFEGWDQVGCLDRPDAQESGSWISPPFPPSMHLL